HGDTAWTVARRTADRPAREFSSRDLLSVESGQAEVRGGEDLSTPGVHPLALSKKTGEHLCSPVSLHATNGLVHPAHAAAARCRRGRLLFLLLDNQCFGREQQPRDRRRVL